MRKFQQVTYVTHETTCLKEILISEAYLFFTLFDYIDFDTSKQQQNLAPTKVQNRPI